MSRMASVCQLARLATAYAAFISRFNYHAAETRTDAREPTAIRNSATIGVSIGARTPRA